MLIFWLEHGFELIISFIYAFFHSFDFNKKTQHKLSFFDFWLVSEMYLGLQHKKCVGSGEHIRTRDRSLNTVPFLYI